MKIRELLAEKTSTDVKIIGPNCTLRETALKLTSHGIGCLVAIDAMGKIVGIVSERDLVRAITKYDAGLVDKPVSDVMTRTVVTCGPRDSVFQALSTMKSQAIRHILVVDDGDLAGMISIRELTRVCELLKVQANTDALTGLSNRRYFLETLASEFDRSRRYGHPLTVAMLDIDQFKRVNDRYGHEAGAEVLCALANLLVGELRTIDRVGRLGGEEFAAIFPETDIAGAKLACDRMLAMIRALEIEVDEAKITFTVSIGLSQAGPATQDATSILKRADELLYDAKSQGRNCILADPPSGHYAPEKERMAKPTLGR